MEARKNQSDAQVHGGIFAKMRRLLRNDAPRISNESGKLSPDVADQPRLFHSLSNEAHSGSCQRVFFVISL